LDRLVAADVKVPGNFGDGVEVLVGVDLDLAIFILYLFHLLISAHGKIARLHLGGSE